MDINKDYYQVLGVTPVAEFAVIKAAYKALAMLYHPDRDLSSKEEMNLKMIELNEAYSILSDPEKRQSYDDIRRESSYGSDFDINDEYSPKGSSKDPLESEWEMIVFHFPDIEDIVSNLERISWKIAYSFKAYLIESKKFSIRYNIAEAMEKEYFDTYFGSNPEIHSFAKWLVVNKEIKAASFLNKAVKTLGDDINHNELIRQIKDKFDLFVTDQKFSNYEFCCHVKDRQGLVRDVFRRRSGDYVIETKVGYKVFDTIKEIEDYLK